MIELLSDPAALDATPERRAYRELVIALVTGDESPSEFEREQVLTAAGKTEEKLQRDVERATRRKQAAERLAQNPKHQDSLLALSETADPSFARRIEALRLKSQEAQARENNAATAIANCDRLKEQATDFRRRFAEVEAGGPLPSKTPGFGTLGFEKWLGKFIMRSGKVDFLAADADLDAMEANTIRKPAFQSQHQAARDAQQSIAGHMDALRAQQAEWTSFGF